MYSSKGVGTVVKVSFGSGFKKALGIRIQGKKSTNGKISEFSCRLSLQVHFVQLGSPSRRFKDKLEFFNKKKKIQLPFLYILRYRIVSTDAAGRWISLHNVNREDHFSISKPVTRLGQLF